MRSGRFAGWTLLLGLLVASSASVVSHGAAKQLARLGICLHASEAVAPKPAAACPIGKTTIERQRARAYELLNHEGPAADAGDDAGFFADKTPETVSVQKNCQQRGS